LPPQPAQQQWLHAYGPAIARARCDAACLEWVLSGAVVLPVALSSAAAVCPQFWSIGARRGDVFPVTGNGRRDYSSEFAQLALQDVVAICPELTVVDAAERLALFQRKHVALGGNFHEHQSASRNPPQSLVLGTTAPTLLASARSAILLPPTYSREAHEVRRDVSSLAPGEQRNSRPVADIPSQLRAEDVDWDHEGCR